jgi:hypothetical protein
MTEKEKRVYHSDTFINSHLTLVNQKQQQSDIKSSAKDFFHNQLTNEGRVDMVNRIINHLKKG